MRAAAEPAGDWRRGCRCAATRRRTRRSPSSTRPAAAWCGSWTSGSRARPRCPRSRGRAGHPAAPTAPARCGPAHPAAVNRRTRPPGRHLARAEVQCRHHRRDRHSGRDGARTGTPAHPPRTEAHQRPASVNDHVFHPRPRQPEHTVECRLDAHVRLLEKKILLHSHEVARARPGAREPHATPRPGRPARRSSRARRSGTEAERAKPIDRPGANPWRGARTSGTREPPTIRTCGTAGRLYPHRTDRPPPPESQRPFE